MRRTHTRAGRARRRAWIAAVSALIGAFAGVAAFSGAMAKTQGAHAGSSDATIAVSSSPKLTPAFDASVHDYVVRCGKRLRVEVTAGDRTSAWIGGRRVGGGTHRASLVKRAGEATVVSGRRGSSRVTYHLRCLPSDFPVWRVKRLGRPQAGWYLATLGRYWSGAAFVTIFDRHGVPVWWRRGGDRGATLLSGGRIAWDHSTARFADRKPPFGIYSLDGRRLGKVHAVRATTDDHELRELPNGDFLLIGTRPRHGVDLRPYAGPRKATVLDGVVQEISPSGRLVWEWSTRDHISLSETGRWFKLKVLPQPYPLSRGGVAYDIVHVNSVDVHGNQVLISTRHTDAVYDVDRASGRIIWKLGGTSTSRSLALSGGSASQLFGGQHDARMLDDGTVTVHDNGSAWLRPPRALRLRVDTQPMQATVLETVDRHGRSLSDCCGSARRLAGGDWVVSWGGLSDFEELTPKGRPLLRISLQPGHYSYRVVPIPLDALSVGTLRSAMDAAARRAAR